MYFHEKRRMLFVKRLHNSHAAKSVADFLVRHPNKKSNLGKTVLLSKY